MVRGYPGVFSSDGVLYCSDVQTMSPSRAASLLADLGYSVTWQVENRDTGSSQAVLAPPSTGFIIDGVAHGSTLILVVETGADAQPASQSCEAG
jgi:hypothetical protein